jgi:hypothetical protein
VKFCFFLNFSFNFIIFLLNFLNFKILKFFVNLKQPQKLNKKNIKYIFLIFKP